MDLRDIVFIGNGESWYKRLNTLMLSRSSWVLGFCDDHFHVLEEDSIVLGCFLQR